MKEGEGFYERVIGGTDEEKKETFEKLQQFFDEPYEEDPRYDLRKTPEDMLVIERTESVVDDMVEHYSGDPKPLPADHIHIFKPGSVATITGGKLHEGMNSPLALRIGVEKGKSELMLARGVAHELFHLKSYKSARVGQSAERVFLYRSGLNMVDRKDQDAEPGKAKEYFGMLEEAIVAECTKRVVQEISKKTPFREEADAVKMIKDWAARGYRRDIDTESDEAKKRKLQNNLELFEDGLMSVANPQDVVAHILKFSKDENERQDYAIGVIKALFERGELGFAERYEERKMLYDLLDELVEKSDGRFRNRDAVFDDFARANFSGNYLPLARTVESILGKGSFRRLANEFAEKKTVTVFTRNLSFGMTGNDVTQLQDYLIAQNAGPAARELKVHGTTKKFGILTKDALVEFQKNVGIVPASGYFGPITRAYVDKYD